jgi:hypothetical protein
MQYGAARFSRCGNYRYLLQRSTSSCFDGPAVTFVMLNPAKATASENDQTISKCIGFAQRWQKQTLNVVNLYGFCTSYQNELYASQDPVGPANQRWLRQILPNSELIVCAWGRLAETSQLKVFQRIVKKYQLECYCIGTNQDGSPKHPARLGYHQRLKAFQT